MKFLVFSFLFLVGCSGVKYKKTVESLDLIKFMGKWYVQAGRFTFLEKDPHNAIEIYEWNDKEKRIDITFSYQQGSFDGETKNVDQKGWVYNEESKAHWKVSPFWPLKFDYLVVDLDEENYQWTAVGVPNTKYLWIMTRQKHPEQQLMNSIIQSIKDRGYPTDQLQYVPHQK